MITLHENDSLQESIEDITASLGKKIKQASEPFSLALAGGNTPKPLYEHLSQQAWPWKNVQVTLTDERWVNEDHAQSNAAMIRASLLKNEAAKAYFLPLKNKEKSAKEGQQYCETQLVTQMPTLDAVILGMGDDGHYASIFPNMDNLAEVTHIESSALCAATHPKGLAADVISERMTLTLPYLVSAKTIYLLCTGEKKKQIIDSVLAKTGSAFPLQDLADKCEANLTDTQLHIFWSPA